LAVDKKDKKKPDVEEDEEKIMAEEARLQKEEEKELRRIQLEEARARQVQRKREEEETDRERQLEIESSHEESLRENEERTYNQSLRGRIANKLGRGKYQKSPQASDEEDGRKQATGKGGSPINPNIIVNTGKETAGFGPILIIIFAYMIWGFDLTPYFGGRYVGFNFSTLLITQTNWYAVVTSGAIVAFLAWSIMTNMFEPHRQFVFFGAFMALALLYSRIYYRLEFANVTIPYFSIIVLAVLALIGLVVLHRNGYDYVASETFCYAVMALTFSFFFINWSWTKDVKAVLHVIFIIGFYFYLYFQPQINKSQLYIFTSLFLVGDFFLYSLNFGNVVLSYFPILVLISSYYLAQFTGSKFARGNLFLLVIAMVFFIIFSPTIAESSEEGTSFERAEATQGAKGFLGGIGESVSNFWGTLKKGVGKQLDTATGGLISDQYGGFVEKNQFEPLGVVFERVKAAQPRFYTDEPVTIWGTIKSRTLSDPVNVQFTCFMFKDNKPIEADKASTNPETKDIIIPDKPFTVYTLEEKDVECTFNKNKLQAGTNTLILAATYNFPTIAYRKVYFIDAERHRAMIRENLDPLKEFGITDKTPKAIATNGPVEIGVGIQDLIPVSDKGTSPALFITLTNRGKITDSKNNPVGQWVGKISEIKELNVVLPKGITIDAGNLENCRPVKFKPFSKQECFTSCISVCAKTCERYQDDSEKSECIDRCNIEKSDTTKRCNDDCDNLFKSDIGAEDYTGYQLAVDDIERRKDVKDFKDLASGRFLTFSCRLNINKNDVLENAPITTKFIRIRARYNYLIESQVPVTVEQAPTIAPTPITYAPSNTELDVYLRNKKSPMEGLGQCIKNAEQKTNVPSIVMLGVAGQESRFGSSGLALNSKNIFSITCGNYDKSDKCTLPNKQDCCKSSTTYKGTVLSFRQYQDFCESVNDFADFISNPSGRFAGSMQYVKEPEKMVQEISKAGYAEEGQQWADAVIKIMKDTQTQITNIAQAQPQPTS